VLSFPCLPLVRFWTGSATAGGLPSSDQWGVCREVSLGRNLPRSPGSFEALTASVPFLPSVRQRSLKQNFTQVIRGRGTEFLKNAQAAWYAKTSQQLCPVVRIGTVWQALSSGDALPMGAFATRGQSNGPGRRAKFPSSAASFHCPFLGGSHQPPDRQLRYYSLMHRLASGLFVGIRHDWNLNPQSGFRRGQEVPQIHKTPLPQGAAFCFPVLVTGLPANYGRWLYPPRLPQAVLAGLPFSGPLMGGCSCRASAVFWGWPGSFPAAGTSLAPSI
jgi:hypothetical protein